MKIYISADVEGVAGITHWDEATKNHPDYPEFRELMTNEVVAACEGALNANATEIVVKDAHGTGRNIISSKLPKEVQLIRGWSGHPYAMVQELDNSFQALLMIGYHSKAGTANNPLAHTIKRAVASVAINGELVSEFLLHAYVAALEQVPLVFVSGDQGICSDVTALNDQIHTLAVSRGIGSSTQSMSPARACQEMKEGVTQALKRNYDKCQICLPNEFTVEVSFKEPDVAYKASFYPGAKQSNDQAVQFQTNDFFEVMRMLLFVIKS